LDVEEVLAFQKELVTDTGVMQHFLTEGMSTELLALFLRFVVPGLHFTHSERLSKMLLARDGKASGPGQPPAGKKADPEAGGLDQEPARHRQLTDPPQDETRDESQAGFTRKGRKPSTNGSLKHHGSVTPAGEEPDDLAWPRVENESEFDFRRDRRKKHR